MKIGIIDLLSFREQNDLYSNYLQPAMISYMPQVIAVWAKNQNHDVWYYTYTGRENLFDDLKCQPDLDVVFISAYTMSAYLAYSISALYTYLGTTTVLGGPHARSYPQDSIKYFDYVVGKCNEELIVSLLNNEFKKKSILASEHPLEFPPVEERWEFIEYHNKKFLPGMLPVIPLMSSIGCPNKCEFCIDSTSRYKRLDLDLIMADLEFLKVQKGKYAIAWQDPNFGVNISKTLGGLETVKAKNLFHNAELSFAQLTEENVIRLKNNQFFSVLPGLESWTAFSKKTGSKFSTPEEKVQGMANQTNMVVSHIPSVQVNVIFGLDNEDVNDQFRLTKEFMRLTPAAYTNFQIMTVFGDSTPVGEKYKDQGRVINLPYNLMDGYSLTNLILENDPIQFYNNFADIMDYSKSPSSVAKKIWHCTSWKIKTFYALKFLSNRMDGSHYKDLSNKIKQGGYFKSYLSGEEEKMPSVFVEQLKKELGVFYQFLPKDILNQFSS
jgi:hypothetical protein